MRTNAGLSYRALVEEVVGVGGGSGVDCGDGALSLSLCLSPPPLSLSLPLPFLWILNVIRKLFTTKGNSTLQRYPSQGGTRDGSWRRGNMTCHNFVGT